MKHTRTVPPPMPGEPTARHYASRIVNVLRDLDLPQREVDRMWVDPSNGAYLHADVYPRPTADDTWTAILWPGTTGQLVYVWDLDYIVYATGVNSTVRCEYATPKGCYVALLALRLKGYTVKDSKLRELRELMEAERTP